jgi:hypothetical protein
MSHNLKEEYTFINFEKCLLELKKENVSILISCLKFKKRIKIVKLKTIEKVVKNES